MSLETSVIPETWGPVYLIRTRANESSLTLSYLAPTLNDFRRSGIYEHVLKAGAVNNTGQQWRRREDGSVLASMPAPPGGEVVALTMGQHELAAVILGQLEKLNSVKVHFSTKVNRFEETADGVRCWVSEEGQNGKRLLSLLASPLPPFLWLVLCCSALNRP